MSGVFGIFSSDVTIRQCEFTDNRGYIGAGMALYISNSFQREVRVLDSLFENNRASEGGAVDVRAGIARFVGCRFYRNESHREDALMTGNGGAVFVKQGGTAEFDRCVFWGNTSHQGFEGGHGGAVWGPAVLRNCTLFRNRAIGAAVSGGAVGGGGLLLDCIVWDNAPDQLDDVTFAEWSDVQEGWFGTGNFDADPRFWGPEHGAFELLPGSPCVDAGDPNLIDEDGSRIDVGAFAYDAGHCGSPGSYCVAKASSNGCLPAIVKGLAAHRRAGRFPRDRGQRASRGLRRARVEHERSELDSVPGRDGILDRSSGARRLTRAQAR